MKYLFTKIIVLICVLLFLQFPLRAGLTPYTNPIRYHAQLNFTVVNDSCKIEQLEIWLPKVLEWENQKDIQIHQITPPPSVDTTDSEYKSGIYYWKFNDLPLLGNTLTMSTEFSFTSYETHFEIDPNMIGKYDKENPLYQKFTKSEPYIECNTSDIKNVANEIVGNETNPYKIARRIYDWVLDHLNYQFVPGLKGALYAMQNGHGECGDYSALFIAICRAAGIPARPVVGMWANPFNEPHVWAEFYLPNYGWIPVDASHADGWGDVDFYFGHLDNRRIIFSKGYNVTLIPEIQIKSLPIFQLGAWWYEGDDTGAHEKISLSIKGNKKNLEDRKKIYRSETYGLELNLPDGWEITNVGGRGRYNLSVEIWNYTNDCRVFLYSREWRADEPRRTPKEITEKDVDFFSNNSPQFVLLNKGSEQFQFLNGYGFLAIMSSYGIGDYYSRYVYFTKDDLIFWLIFQCTEENYEENYLRFIELANNLRLLNPQENE